MARQHGRNSRIYIAVASGGSAENIPFLNSWSLDFAVDKVEVTAFGDANKVYVSGLPDASGSFGGFYDDATAQFLTAASDGVARKMYLYPDSTDTGEYFHGEILLDFSMSSGVSEAHAISANWNASSAIVKVT